MILYLCVDGWNIPQDRLEFGDIIKEGEFTSENLFIVSRFCLDIHMHIHSILHAFVCIYVCMNTCMHT